MASNGTPPMASGAAPFAGAMPNSPAAGKNLTQALSVISLSNICFKECVVGAPKQSKELTGFTRQVLGSAGVEDMTEWKMSERETVCVHNCAKSYIELKDFLHT